MTTTDQALAFPDPASPEGQRWAAAGWPVKDGKPDIPPAPAAPPAAVAGGVPPVGAIARYDLHDAYVSPARDRVALILVTGHEQDADGNVRIRGVQVGYEDTAASFTLSQLR